MSMKEYFRCHILIPKKVEGFYNLMITENECSIYSRKGTMTKHCISICIFIHLKTVLSKVVLSKSDLRDFKSFDLHIKFDDNIYIFLHAI